MIPATVDRGFHAVTPVYLADFEDCQRAPTKIWRGGSLTESLEAGAENTHCLSRSHATFQAVRVRQIANIRKSFRMLNRAAAAKSLEERG